MNINRREALARLMAITGTAMVGAEFFLSGCARPAPNRTQAFTPDELALLDEIADTIIPTTSTPGAKAAKVGAFMAMTAHDCYDDASYASFRGGIAKVDAASRKQNGKPFMQATAAERTAVLTALDGEQKQFEGSKQRGEATHYFRLMKDLTILGYFSSEIGCTQALRYVESPGAYHGDVAYHHGDRSWYNPTRRIT